MTFAFSDGEPYRRLPSVSFTTAEGARRHQEDGSSALWRRKKRLEVAESSGTAFSDETEDESVEDEMIRKPFNGRGPSFFAQQQAMPLKPLLTDMPWSQRVRSLRTRLLWGLLMVSSCIGLVLAGHIWVIFLVIAIQTLVFKEVIAIAYVPSKEKKIPYFRLINWYFLLAANHFLYGESLINYLSTSSIYQYDFIQQWAIHHRFYSFVVYTIGIVVFVMNLKRGLYKFQFSQFAWTHMALLLVVFQSHTIINNILEGMIWFFIPTGLVITNDVFAYVCGFFFGRTRLIRLSPSKTWEGFIGGAICTLAFGFIASGVIAQMHYFICPVRDLSASAWSNATCEPHPVFVPAEYCLPVGITNFLYQITGSKITHMWIRPLQWHTLVLTVFASLIAPFGGFFASGVKRAFKIKDFGDSIPGHGGITDRMDCQFIMGTFSYVYIQTFIKPSIPALAPAVMRLPLAAQKHLFVWLATYLQEEKGIDIKGLVEQTFPLMPRPQEHVPESESVMLD